MDSSRASLDVNLDSPGLWRTVRRSSLIAAGIFAGAVFLSFAYASRLEPVYEASGKLLFKVDSTAALTSLSDKTDPGTLRSLLVDQTPVSTQIEVIKSRPLLEKTIYLLDLKDEAGELLKPDDLAEDIEVKLIGGTDILRIAYQHPDPRIAAQTVNTLVQVYQDYSIDASRVEIREAREFVSEQLPQTEQSVQQAETALRTFLETNEAVAIDEEAKVSVSSSEALRSEIVSSTAAIEEADARLRSLQAEIHLSPQEALAVSKLSQTPSIQNLLTSLKEKENEVAIKQVQFTPESPVLAKLLAEEAAVRRLLSRESEAVLGYSANVDASMLSATPLELSLIENFLTTKIEREGLAERLDILQASASNYQQRVQTLPRLQQRKRELERQLGAAQTTYESLLNRLEELQVQENEAAKNTRFIEPAAIPSKAVDSQQQKVVAAGVLGGAALAILFVLTAAIPLGNRQPAVKRDEFD